VLLACVAGKKLIAVANVNAPATAIIKDRFMSDYLIKSAGQAVELALLSG
jgi:hypothetical protein